MEITSLGLLTIKAESTYGTDAVPTLAANLIPPIGDSVSWNVQSTPVDRKLMDGTLDNLVGFNTMPNVNLKFRYELRGNRTDGTTADISSGNSAHAIEIDSLLQAANLNPTYTAESTTGSRNGYVVYQPKVYSGVGPSVTCYWYTALKLHKLVGGKVNVEKITWEAGKIVTLDISITGKYVAPIDNNFPTSGTTFLATKPPLFDTASVSIGSYNGAVLSQLTVDLGNKVKLRKSAIDADSIAGFVISGMDPKGTLDPESVAEATNPFWADWRNSNVKTITVTTGGTTAATSGNQFTGTFVSEYKGLPYGARDDVRILQVAFNIVKADLTGAAGSQFQLKFS
ncbi:phage tail tube protein [Pedosphaera parvula]|uniref:Uncharacterized protein n=1 Tax=Pedosphaera parvula (strain Ellin514) TaxID=320771 RepID=B9XDF4_PEDPL|nr:phage tail tube protein [Pedosphaera parvula]EEF62100.1 conserved hypothetical protein [Pedosphaera parvula Ellin514]